MATSPDTAAASPTRASPSMRDPHRARASPARRPWRTEVTRDAIYHMALGIGDLSPLYHDEEYARRTRWGTLLAPPIMIQTLRHAALRGLQRAARGTARRALDLDGLALRVEAPAHGGRPHHAPSATSSRSRSGRASSAAGAPCTRRTRPSTRTRTARRSGSATTRGSASSATRRPRRRSTATPRSRSGRPTTSSASWTEYAAEKRATERVWDDVQVGDALPDRCIKGPLTPTAEIAFESQLGIYLVGNKVAANSTPSIRSSSSSNEQGVPEPPQRVHWDNAFTTRLLGLAGSLRSRAGALRVAHPGRDRLDGRRRPPRDDSTCRYLKFNYIGDVTLGARAR